MLRSLAELNHVLRIFSPTHTPRLPKLQSWYSREDSNLHQRFRRPPSYPLNDRSISELHCKGRKRFSHYEISARLADFGSRAGGFFRPLGSRRGGGTVSDAGQRRAKPGSPGGRVCGTVRRLWRLADTVVSSAVKRRRSDRLAGQLVGADYSIVIWPSSPITT